MRDCEHIEQISAYYDGELSPEERRLMETHLQQCDVCARELRQLKRLSSLMSGVRMPELPVGVLRRLHDNAASLRQRMIVRLAERLTAAAAAILVVCAAWIFVDRARGEALPTVASPWELTAVSPADDPLVSEQQQIARWIVEDLSLGNTHD